MFEAENIRDWRNHEVLDQPGSGGERRLARR